MLELHIVGWALLQVALAACVTLWLLRCATSGRFQAVFPEGCNFEGRTVYTAGLALAAGLAVANIHLRHVDSRWFPWSESIVIAGFALAGSTDDRFGDRSATGFRGHLRAALNGHWTTGLTKIVVGGATAVLAAATVPSSEPHSIGWIAASAAVIALSANAFNLIDTRPVRATTLFIAIRLLWVAGIATYTIMPFVKARFQMSHDIMVCVIAIEICGVLLDPTLICPLVFLKYDRRRLVMLGDAGSNVLGALTGLMLISITTSWVWPSAMLAALIAFHVYTEGHSLNAAIAARPWLNRLDLALRGPTPIANDAERDQLSNRP